MGEVITRIPVDTEGIEKSLGDIQVELETIMGKVSEITLTIQDIYLLFRNPAYLVTPSNESDP